MKTLPILELMMAQSLPNLLLDVDAGTGYEEFAKSILNISNEIGLDCDLERLKLLCNTEVYPNGELCIFVNFLDKRHEYIVPKGSWIQKHNLELHMTQDDMERINANICTRVRLHPTLL